MSIHIEDLTVRFKNGVTAINHANLNIPNGIFGLLGENGAGKTTLAKLLIGLFVNEWEGDIRINDIPIKELDMIHARKELLGYVSQSPFFVEDSILYNLTFLPAPFIPVIE